MEISWIIIVSALKMKKFMLALPCLSTEVLAFVYIIDVLTDNLTLGTMQLTNKYSALVVMDENIINIKSIYLLFLCITQ